jgi:hypothetical protein
VNITQRVLNTEGTLSYFNVTFQLKRLEALEYEIVIVI